MPERVLETDSIHDLIVQVEELLFLRLLADQLFRLLLEQLLHRVPQLDICDLLEPEVFVTLVSVVNLFSDVSTFLFDSELLSFEVTAKCTILE